MNQLLVHDFGSSLAKTVHLGNPFHLVVCLELFGYTLTICHLFYEPKQHFFRLLVDFCKITVELACGQQIAVQRLSVLFDIPQVTLPLYADFSAFFVI
jgi:hypothetical protein